MRWAPPPEETKPQERTLGFSVDTYQAAYQAMTGADVLPGRAAYRRQIVVGRLANLGIVNGQRGA